jgi:RNA polymerase sigma-70 factor (ECF subfamily)
MFLETYEAVLAYALRRADPADAEDVVADTYAIAWRRLDDIPPDPLPWLYAVARRTLANVHRSTRRRSRLAGRLAAEGRPTTPGAADSDGGIADALLMRAALTALREPDREALMLVAWEGLTNEQAASALGVSPQVFAVRLHRARRRLEAEIQRRSQDRPSDDPSGER